MRQRPTAGAWCLGPAELAAIAADHVLLGRLAAGELPDERTPTGRRLAAWLRDVVDDAPEVTR